MEEAISNQASKLDHVEQLPGILLLEAANILKIIIGWKSESYTKKHKFIEQS